jgi:hypothetical protein
MILRYRIALVNISRRPFRFRGCPVYVQSLDRKDAYVLNCRSVGTIAPRSRAVFEMRVRAPERVGPDALFWWLPRTFDVGDDARIVVTR